MGGIKFPLLAVWVLSSDWPSSKLQVCDFFSGAYVKPPRLGEECAVPRLCIVYPGICLTTGENHGKPQSG